MTLKDIREIYKAEIKEYNLVISKNRYGNVRASVKNKMFASPEAVDAARCITEFFKGLVVD